MRRNKEHQEGYDQGFAAGYQEGYIKGRVSRREQTDTEFLVTKAHQEKYPLLHLPLDTEITLIKDMTGAPIGFQERGS